jgi:ATP-dependent exoDNAse (exonuclease V) beta subunit
MSAPELVDAVARQRIRTELGTTLVVEAAAGTGKTSELVQRIVRVVQSGAGTLSSSVAVTFTEKAAGEMKLRVRTELDRALSRALSAQERARVEAALAELEAAKIGTIHGFCAELLRGHPVEANVDPAFEVADTQRARQLQQGAFDDFFARAAQAPPEGVRRVLARAGNSEPVDDPAKTLFDAARNLIETRDFDTPFRRPSYERGALIDALGEQLRALAELGPRAFSAYDRLGQALRLLGRRLRALSGASHDRWEATLRSLAAERDIWSGAAGQGKQFGNGVARADVVERRAAAKAALDQALLMLGADLAACLSSELRPVIARYETLKAEHGVLDFFDLLMHTRNLLYSNALVRTELQRRFSHLFIDEFQDTDPIQTEIMLLLAADDANEREPFRTRPIPGKLFLVGDPKQSIYRFRRADVSLYERVKRHLLSSGAELVQLSTSFRSLPAIQALVNASFAPLMGGDAARGQASYVPLSAFRRPVGDQPAVIALPVPAPFGKRGGVTKTAVNASLPDAIGAFLDWLLRASGFVVPEDGQSVPLAARHVCLLFRRFHGAWEGDLTRDHVRALEARGIPHVLSGGRAFHTREEVMAAYAVLRAIERPDDALQVYATLRGPFVGFQDDVLLSFRQTHGSLSPLRSGSWSADGMSAEHAAVLAVLTLLLRLHRTRNRLPIAHALGSFLSELRAHAGVAIWPTGEQALGNISKLLGLAQSYERRRGAPSFRGFLAWLEQLAEEKGGSDATVVEESSDGVRLMTVHGAKGLEFPVVVLCDPTMNLRTEFASRYVDAEQRLWAQPLCGVSPLELIEQRELVCDHDEAESVRLTYVAVTRARELLVVPVTGGGPIEGWLAPLGPALFPPAERRKQPEAPPPNLPAFTRSSVVTLASGHEQAADDWVVPGVHAPSVGDHRVLFWDPNLLDLGRRAKGGVLQNELLLVDKEGGRHLEAEARYTAFRAAREAVRVASTLPSVTMRSVTQVAAPADEAEPGTESGGPSGVSFTPDPSVPMPELLDSGIDRSGRPRGKRFGSLVHGLLQHASLSAAREQLTPLARHLGRSLGASAAEVERAVEHAIVALAHPLMARARAAQERGELFRETPITALAPDGSLLDGVIDLGFRETDDRGPRMVLVDYKTDAVIVDLGTYARQLAAYADAIQRARGEPVECVLFRV